MTATNYAFWPVILYGIPLLGAAIAYYILTLTLLRTHPQDSPIAKAISNEMKERVSLALYGLSILAALWHPWAACVGYFVVALIWLVPDRRMEAWEQRSLG